MLDNKTDNYLRTMKILCASPVQPDICNKLLVTFTIHYVIFYEHCTKQKYIKSIIKMVVS